MKSSLFKEKEELLSTELDEDINKITKKAKDIIKRYTLERKKETNAQFIEELRRSPAYPYKENIHDKIEEIERDVFDVVIAEANKTSNTVALDRDEKELKLIFSLIREAIRQNPSTLTPIFTSILDLSKDDTEKLRELLEDTELSNIITTSYEISDRIKFIESLEQIVTDPVTKKVVKERSQLHKLIERNLWIFGDDYSIGDSDKSLKTILLKHLKIEGKELNKEIVTDNLNDIPDLYIYKKYMNGIIKETFKNVVIELKRPDFILNSTEQIQKYALAIANEPNFNKNTHHWEFIFLVTNYDSNVEMMVNQDGRESGVLFQKDHIIIKILKWGEIIDTVKLRLKFLKNSLYENDIDFDFKEYLKKNYEFMNNL